MLSGSIVTSFSDLLCTSKLKSSNLLLKMHIFQSHVILESLELVCQVWRVLRSTYCLPGGAAVKNSPATAGDTGDAG